jgi:hypothetical protein
MALLEGPFVGNNGDDIQWQPRRNRTGEEMRAKIQAPGWGRKSHMGTVKFDG